MKSLTVGAANHQQGIILFVTMIFLLILGMVAFNASSRTVISEKIAGNQWERDRAYQAAEAALIDGSNWLFALETIDEPEGNGTGSDGVWEQGSMNNNLYDATYNWAAGIDFGAATGIPNDMFLGNFTVPSYVIENVGWSADDASPENASAGFITFYYGVAAVGYGQGDTSQSVLQTISAKRYR